MNFKKWVKSIQTAGYNGTHTVLVYFIKKSDVLLVNSPIQFIFKTARKCNDNNSNAPSESKIGRMTHHSIFLYHISQNGIHKHGFQHKKGKNNLEFVKKIELLTTLLRNMSTFQGTQLAMDFSYRVSPPVFKEVTQVDLNSLRQKCYQKSVKNWIFEDFSVIQVP